MSKSRDFVGGCYPACELYTETLSRGFFRLVGIAGRDEVETKAIDIDYWFGIGWSERPSGSHQAMNLADQIMFKRVVRKQ